MTLRLPMFLAASFFLASNAYASPRLENQPIRIPPTGTLISTNTDEVRALVAIHADSPIRTTATATLTSTNTDEVRAVAAGRVVPVAVGSATAASPAKASNGDSRMTACAHSCPCQHG